MESSAHTEILLNIDDSNLRIFSDFYRDHKYICYASSCLANGIRIKEMIKAFPIRFISPIGAWKINGTFFMIVEFENIYEVGIFAALIKSQSTLEAITTGLTLSKRINYDSPNKNVVFKHIHHNFYNTLRTFIKTQNLNLEKDEKFYIFKLSKDAALKYEIKIPDEVQLRSLEPENAFQIHAHWPHFYPPTDEYFHILIQVNGGYGLFSRKDGQLLSWGLKTMTGTIGFVQTIEKSLRNGYASMLIKILAKELAFEEQNPVAMVEFYDTVSQSLFQKLGFQVMGICHNIYLRSTKNTVTSKPPKEVKLKKSLSFRLSRAPFGNPSKKDLSEAGPSWGIRFGSFKFGHTKRSPPKTSPLAESTHTTTPTAPQESASKPTLPKSSRSRSSGKNPLMTKLLRMKNFSMNFITTSLSKMGIGYTPLAGSTTCSSLDPTASSSSVSDSALNLQKNCLLQEACPSTSYGSIVDPESSSYILIEKVSCNDVYMSSTSINLSEQSNDNSSTGTSKSSNDNYSQASLKVLRSMDMTSVCLSKDSD